MSRRSPKRSQKSRKSKAALEAVTDEAEAVSDGESSEEEGGVGGKATSEAGAGAGAAEAVHAKGDMVKVIKTNSTIEGEVGEVLDPDWHGMVKLVVKSGKQKGEVKSYMAVDVAKVKAGEIGAPIDREHRTVI